MASGSRERILENLAIAAILSFLVLLAATASFLADAAAVDRERGALSGLAGGSAVESAPSEFADHDFHRIYRINGGGGTSFGAVFTLGSASGTVLAAAIFSPQGELDAVKALGDCAPRLAEAGPQWFSDFLGKGSTQAYPASKGASRRPAAVSGATESLLSTGETLSRLSAAVRAAAKEHP